ncbi:Putative uncharacterized protein [Taphrina deformans PYCC 5710]|uniref:Uncharacterized protein n=1 Tax=Taphrina deformans (strain PYCC 5710 / ATCC 11124 / CBS 356.35 / IMI 108563 / JCM 9778 / NBRC 8474) TaxID=1097556 RepID=R4ZXZ8_TAPDE|nr:Putative uncharacterized protein [Taphrina deformans PYCC 5710]|eukprot:CCX35403.1 Putative uncharacterized protein [Taphrina deformans PYCC 5710]
MHEPPSPVDSEDGKQYNGSRWHSFLVGGRYTNLKLAFKASLAVVLTLAIGEADNVSAVEGTTLYVSTIFATLFMANKTRVQTIENALIAGVLMAAVIPYGMLGYLCAKATRDPARDATALRQYASAMARGDTKNATPAIFYQPEAAAVSAVFLFGLAWAANVAKTLFVPFTFPIVASTIVCGILFLQGYLYPEWSQFYTIVKQVLYSAYIGLASSTIVGLVVFPYNAREPYLALTGRFLDTVEKLISGHANHFSTAHVRYRQHLSAENAESSHSSNTETKDSTDRIKSPSKKAKNEPPNPMVALQGLREALTAISAVHALSKVPAKREVALGHMRGSELEAMHKHCRSLLIPVLGCNLWSQVADVINKDETTDSVHDQGRETFLQSLGAETNGGSEEEDRIYRLMAERIAPRIKALSNSCTDAIVHIQRLLHLGPYSRPPLLFRPFVRSPQGITEADLHFSDTFEAEIAAFWAEKHADDHEAFRFSNGRPSVASLLILYMESTMHAMSESLLVFTRWAEEQHSSGIMTSRRLILPKSSRYTKAISRGLYNLKQHTHEDGESNEIRRTTTGMRGIEDDYEVEAERQDATDAFLVKAKSTLVARTGFFSGVALALYRFKIFLFDSNVSAFGFRAAVAMTAGALPAFFPDSVAAFLRFRLIWITFTVLLGLQPVLGRGIAASVFRVLGTIVGGVAGLVVLEVGRVAGGRLPLFFLTLLVPFYFFQLDPKKNLLPVLLTVITEDLVVGYELQKDKLGVAAIERSGQAYLAPPALMGYRILLTLAGVVIALLFSIFPSLPTARNLLRDNVAKHFFLISDMYLLCSVRRTADRFDLPKDIDKAITKKQAESLALSAAATDLIGLTGFEPSPRGVFPRDEWSKFLLLFNNFNTALAVSNALFTRLEQGGQQYNLLRESDSDLAATADEYSRVAAATVLAIGNALFVWQPISPTLRSPVVAHQAVLQRLSDLSSTITAQRERGLLSADTVTHFGAHRIVSALMSKYLEDLLKQTTVLVGESGFRSYLTAHRKEEKLQ